ncbi:hypothetical protein LQU94_05690 [Peptoniphilus sp. KCTC 25270]|uniref:hypothetical protein n=1 Tax=Peptoniphilus sp. KCTC 25270 TaxID=2897414 RepID=UPI001E4AB921|nr:hypothetical protein [Peptoniphilus sp. KCTC 25270]MCD1147603.1 hypothetical protein [Peptoniphilus sp. KCTC 25270]
MNTKKTIPFFLSIAILILSIINFKESNEGRYQKITQRMTPIQVRDLSQKEKESKTIYIGSPHCEDCLSNINQIILTAKKLPGKVYYLNVENMKEEDRSYFIEEFGISHIPSILLLSKEESKVIAPEEWEAKK